MSEEKMTEAFEENSKAREDTKAAGESAWKTAEDAASKAGESAGKPGDKNCEGAAGDAAGKSADDAAGDAAGKSADDAAGEAAEKTAEEAAEEKDSERYLRLMAEFQNFKKRAAKEKSDIHAYANEKIIGELLPVLDNFERALSSNAADDPEAYAKGMAMICEQMKTALEKAGLKEIEALGKEFNPTMHNAVISEESEEHESGFVSKELQKGYTLNGKVVRPTMVAVAK